MTFPLGGGRSIQLSYGGNSFKPVQKMGDHLVIVS